MDSERGPRQSVATRPQIPVTIVTGFLGAGKTSLLNHILTSGHGKRIAVLVNDFGAVNIDAELIDNRDGEVVSLANGCICCSLSEGLLMSVMQLVRSDNPPEQIVVETSGVSDPFEVAGTFLDPELQPYAPLDGILTVVDAELAPSLDGQMLQLAQRQVLAADVVVLSKVDLVDDASKQQAQAWVADVAPHVRLVEAVHGRVPMELLFDIGGAVEVTKSISDLDAGNSVAHEVPPFDSYTYESEQPLSAHVLHALLSRLPKTIFRAKGLVNLLEKPDHPCVLQSTGKRATLTVGQPWGDRTPVTQLVFIGSQGGVNGDWIGQQLSGRSTLAGSA